MAAAQVCFRPKGSDICPVHQGHKVCFECEDCPGTLVCSLCITSNHKRHGIRDIKIAVQEKVEKISSYIEKAKQETLPDLLQAMKKTSRKLLKSNQLYQVRITKVQEHGETLKAEIDLNTAKTVSRLGSLLKKNTEMLEKHQKNVEKLELQLQEEIKELLQTLKTDGKEALVYDIGTEVSDTIKVPPMPPVKSFTFSPCKDFKFYLEKAFGDMKKDIGPDKTFSVVKLLDQPKTLYEQETSYPIWTNCICPTTNNMAWTSGGGDDKLHLVDDEGAEHMTLPLNVDIFRMCIHPTTGVLYISCKEDKSVRSVNTDTYTTTVKFNTGEEPWAIACMDDDRMVVSTCNDAGNNREVCMNMYTMAGRLQHHHIHKGEYVPNLTVCHQTNRIAVLARTSGVRVLNELFQKVYTYKGEGIHRKKGANYELFDCCTAVFLDQYLLLGDFYNHSIHILTAATGKCTKIIHTDSMSHMVALGVQQNGDLWVGCQNPRKLLCVKYCE